MFYLNEKKKTRLCFLFVEELVIVTEADEHSREIMMFDLTTITFVRLDGHADKKLISIRVFCDTKVF